MVKSKPINSNDKNSTENSQDSSIFVTKQECFAQAPSSKNKDKVLYLQVKNLSFTLLVCSKNLDLKNMKILAKLIYDFDKDGSLSFKEVDALKSSPMDYISHVDSSSSLTMKVTIHVLSSFHEGANFRVHISAVDKEDEGKIYECYSYPIKVLSKQSQIRSLLEKKTAKMNKSLKRKRTEESPSSLSINNNNNSIISPAQNSPLFPSNSRSIQDFLLKLETQQKTQAALLERVLSNQLSQIPSSSLNLNSPSNFTIALEQAFTWFIRAYQNSPSEERKSKLRKVFKELHSPALDSVSEFVGLCKNEIPLSESLTNSSNLTSSSTIPESTCSHKQQLDAFDNISSQFLTNPSYFTNSEQLSSLL